MILPPNITDGQKKHLKSLKQLEEFETFLKVIEANAQSIEDHVLKTPFTKETFEALQLRQIEALKLRQIADFGRNMLKAPPRQEIESDVLGTREDIMNDLLYLKKR